MNFELFVALKFMREARFQTLLILLAVGIGVGVVVFLSALIDGLQGSLIARTLGSQAHVLVTVPEEVPATINGINNSQFIVNRVERAPARDKALSDWEGPRQAIMALPGVVASSPTIAGAAFAARGTVTRAIALRGIDPSSFEKIIPVSPRLVAGTFSVTGAQAAIGKNLAMDLGLRVGDKLRILAGSGSGEVFSVSSIFDLGNKDINRRWVLVSLTSAQALLAMPGSVSAIEVTVRDVFAAKLIADAITARTGLKAESWMQLNAELLLALKSQSSSRYLIEFFVILSVAFGIASVLVVSVVQKSKEIGVMKAFGTATSSVIRMFLMQGAIVGLIGSVIGCAMGSALALAFSRLVRNPDGSATFPVEVTPSLLLMASVLALVVGVLAAALPARRAARLDPAGVIRYG